MVDTAWWNYLIQEIEKVSLTCKKEGRMVENVRSWVKQQVGPSLALLVLVDDGAIDDIIKIIVEGCARLKDKHFRILTSKKKKHKGVTDGFMSV